LYHRNNYCNNLPHLHDFLFLVFHLIYILVAGVHRNSWTRPLWRLRISGSYWRSCIQ
jgi:hypothetical protein